MFYRFFDDENSGYLLGHIVSWKSKQLTKTDYLLILEFENKKEYLSYSSYENLISDIDALVESLNDYYLVAMNQEQSNEMGYDISACGYEDGTINEMEEEEEEDKITGFKMEKK